MEIFSAFMVALQAVWADSGFAGFTVGNGMMIHCGSPIGYANLNDAYWKSHFHSFGRMPGL